MTRHPSIATSRDEAAADIKFRVKASEWGRPNSNPVYPRPPQTGGVEEDIHGIHVHDPWRSLEELETESTQRFIEAQNNLSVPYLSSHPLRTNLEISIDSLLRGRRSTVPKLQGNGYYYWHFNSGSWQRDVIVRSKYLKRDFGQSPVQPNIKGSTGPEIVLDLNQENNMSLYMESWSPSGRYYTAVLQNSGSDWQTLRTIDTETMRPVGEELGHSKFTFGVCWLGEKGFLYKRKIKVFGNNQTESIIKDLADNQFGLFFHYLGQAQSEDICVWKGRGPNALQWIIGLPRIMSLNSTEQSGHRQWLCLDIYPSTTPETEVMMFEIPKALYEHSADRMGTEVARLFADNTWDKSSPGDILDLKESIPVNVDNDVIIQAKLFAENILAIAYSRHACASITFFNASSGEEIGEAEASGLHGRIKGTDKVIQTGDLPVPPAEIEPAKPVALPKHASVGEMACRSDKTELFLTVNSFVAEPYVLEATASDARIDLEMLDRVPGSPSDDLVCEQTFYTSHDGTKIPIFICRLSSVDLGSGPKPLLLHAYGGFQMPMKPHFDAFLIAFMRNLGGVFAAACIRGGGEYGKLWHQEATGPRRSTSWDDFAWAAKYLHQRGVSTPSLTTIYGTSNGGLLSSAVALRNPELIRVSLPDVPITDLLRFHKFTMGRLWKDEYGDPDDPEIFPQIYPLSPLHNVKSQLEIPRYPAIMVTTADHDTRVIPGHALKFLAELQSRRRGDGQPLVLGRVYENTGHEPGAKTIAQKTMEATDRLVFILSNIDFQAE